MRISDWSSEVCSSDLKMRCARYPLLPRSSIYRRNFRGRSCVAVVSIKGKTDRRMRAILLILILVVIAFIIAIPTGFMHIIQTQPATAARKRVGEGKRVSVRVDLGGRRIIKKKK